MAEKIRSLATFYSLPKKQQKAVMMLFSQEFTQVQISNEIHVAPQTVSAWKQNDAFRRAQDEYNQFMLRDLVNEAIIAMRGLLRAKSEMARFNAASYIIDKAEPAKTEDELVEVADWSTMAREAEKMLPKDGNADD